MIVGKPFVNNPSFTAFLPDQGGLLYDYSENSFPTKLYAWHATYHLTMNDEGSTFFGFVTSEHAVLKTTSRGEYTLQKGMYFCIEEPFTVIGGSGIVIERTGYRGMFSLGGPVENWGRLKYIDGCTDSLLVAPIKKGDACLNALFFPQQINQTPHTHPSMRVGVVFSGMGECITPYGNFDLQPGLIFIIHEEGGGDVGVHSFKTEDENMIVIAYHPDSDFGPEDQFHPMINRTIVGGVSASYVESIRTK